jgi:urease accessory protein
MLTTSAVVESERAVSSPWQAALDLRYERRAARTVLVRSAHRGPLVVQKSLYPEGESVCQNIIVHPPGGVAGGDNLRVAVVVGIGAQAQITTPGAAKWYRSAGAFAKQRIGLTAQGGALLEWLPQEAIVFDGAMADLELTVDLDGDAMFIGWDIVCLGRTASGERLARGVLKHRLAIRRDAVPIFIERGIVHGGSRMLASPAGLDSAPVFGTFFAACASVSDELLNAGRATIGDDGGRSVTRLPGLLLARFRGSSAEAARQYFTRMWQCVRPELIGRYVVMPRIWRT